MSHDSRERSGHDGEPVECYRWVMGASTWLQTPVDFRVPLNIAPWGLETYEPAAIARDASEFNQEDDSGTLTVSLHRLNPVAGLFIPGAPPSAVGLTIYRFHVDDGNTVVAFVGKVVAASYEGATVALQVAPMTAALKRNIPRIQQQRQCVWALYGAGCGVNKATFTDAGTVLEVGTDYVRAAIFSSHADGWYDTGWLEDASGNRRAVVSHVGDKCTLQYPFVSLAVGAAISGVAGCLRTSAVCTAKFSNLVNFMGFERIPSKDIYRLGIS